MVPGSVNDPQPPPSPTRQGPRGILYDFNDGARILLPNGPEWRVRLRDLDTGNVLFENVNHGALVNSTKHYYVRFAIDVWKNGEQVFTHEMDLRDQPVLMHFYVGTLGDIVGWFSYAAKFQEQHGCELTCAMSELLIPLFRDAYPQIHFVGPNQVDPTRFYASYKVMMYFGDEERQWQPCEARYVGLHRSVAYLLGVDPAECRPRIALPDESRPIPEPYVVIATQATAQAKYWNNPHGWRDVIAFLKEHGYRVVCIDKNATHGEGLVWNHTPAGAEDLTGDRPLVDRARWLRHCDFFIGLSSGLSWLAWAAGAKVVLISGFTHPNNEFDTPYRIINYHACNSCWNDPGLRFNHFDFLWCPRHAGTERQFECTRLITAEQVKATIRRIPGFGQHSRTEDHHR